MKAQRVLPLIVLTLLALFLGACPPRSPGNLEMTVSHEKFQTEIRMRIEGKNYTPNGPVTITITNFPRKTGNITRNRVADASGKFSVLESFSYTQAGRDEVFVNILVTGRDDTTGNFKITDVSAEPYLIR